MSAKFASRVHPLQSEKTKIATVFMRRTKRLEVADRHATSRPPA
jgi:hypothetical protein